MGALPDQPDFIHHSSDLPLACVHWWNRFLRFLATLVLERHGDHRSTPYHRFLEWQQQHESSLLLAFHQRGLSRPSHPPRLVPRHKGSVAYPRETAFIVHLAVDHQRECITTDSFFERSSNDQ